MHKPNPKAYAEAVIPDLSAIHGTETSQTLADHLLDLYPPHPDADGSRGQCMTALIDRINLARQTRLVPTSPKCG